MASKFEISAFIFSAIFSVPALPGMHINLLIFGVLWIETLKVFGKKSKTDALLGIMTFGFYIMLFNYYCFNL